METTTKITDYGKKEVEKYEKPKLEKYEGLKTVAAQWWRHGR